MKSRQLTHKSCGFDNHLQLLLSWMLNLIALAAPPSWKLPNKYGHDYHYVVLCRLSIFFRILRKHCLDQPCVMYCVKFKCHITCGLLYLIYTHGHFKRWWVLGTLYRILCIYSHELSHYYHFKVSKALLSFTIFIMCRCMKCVVCIITSLHVLSKLSIIHALSDIT